MLILRSKLCIFLSDVKDTLQFFYIPAFKNLQKILVIKMQ